MEKELEELAKVFEETEEAKQKQEQEKAKQPVKKLKVKTELTHFRLPVDIKNDMLKLAQKLNYNSLSQAIVCACGEWVRKEKRAK